MLDFFERQAKARKKTALLIAYFVLAVILINLAVYLAVVVILGLGLDPNFTLGHGRPTIWHPMLFLWTSIVSTSVIVLGSLIKTTELSQGGRIVAEWLGGEPVDPNTNDPQLRRLLNVVEEMAIASGLPVPQVYVLPDPSINAFAAGLTTDDAVIGVTSGAVKHLNRDELQGVIGHEFSHILNGDVRLNIQLIGLIFGIASFVVIGRVLLRIRSRSGRDRNPLPLLGLALIVIGSAGVFFSRLIQAAVSRQREYLADASAVQFTRNPEGLAGALKKIGALVYGSTISSPHVEETAHIFFENPRIISFARLFATHPPLHERIRALDPAWDGKFPKLELPKPSLDRETPTLRATPQPRRYPEQGAAAVRPEVLLAAAGTVTPEQVEYAAGWRQNLTPEVESALRDPLGAAAVLFGILLSHNQTVRQTQLDSIAREMRIEIDAEMRRVFDRANALPASAKLPVLNLALPALRHMSPTQFERFRRALDAVISADQTIDLFEFAVQKAVKRHLEGYFYPQQSRVPIQYYSYAPLLQDYAVVLSAVAHAGASDPEQAARAFQTGWLNSPLRMFTPPPLLERAYYSLDKLDKALDRLNQGTPILKDTLITAAAFAVATDGVIKPTEAELLRAIADALGCPIPRFIKGI